MAYNKNHQWKSSPSQIYINKATAAKTTETADPATVTLFKAAAFGEVGDEPGAPEVGDETGAPPVEDVGGTAGAVGGAGGEVVGEEVGEDSGVENGEGVVVDGGEAVGALVGEVLGDGVGEEDGGDLVGGELGAWPRAQLAMRAKRTKQAKDLAIVIL
ncbi:hypothetical protein DITRI_Ditri05aG0136800 [Diplodiscus trichospermus]